MSFTHQVVFPPNHHLLKSYKSVHHDDSVDRLIHNLEMNDYGRAAYDDKASDPLVRFQFWPSAIAFGTQIGNKFNQVLGAKCAHGTDMSRLDPDGNPLGYGKSYVGFDFQRETVHVKAGLIFPSELQAERNLPPALRPVNAEISFEDITSQGISLQSYTGIFPDGRPRYIVTMTTETEAGPIHPIPEGPCGYPIFWNTWRWVMNLTVDKFHNLSRCISQLRALAQDEPDMELVSRRENKPITHTLDARDYADQYTAPKLDHIRFSTRTLVEGLIAHAILRPVDVSRLASALNQLHASSALQDRLVESLFKEGRIRNVESLVRARARYLSEEMTTPLSHLVLIRTVQVTPTRLLIGAPTPEPSNSVTRRYAGKIDSIIRVQFSDEEDRIFVQDYTKQVDSQRPDLGVMARVRRALRWGLVVGGRRYLPVASSSSQQKEHAMWFIDNKEIDMLELQRWMGQVDETIIAKHAARMGLPFSTSRIVEINVDIGLQIPDVERNGHCFTDGVGLAGFEVMREAARALGFREGINSTPSAIQFRLGGAKGMLAFWPGRVKDHEVKMRKSMVKFKSGLKDLNVVRFIMIMCANGIPEQLMIDIFNDAVASIKGLRERVATKTLSRDDHKLISTCSEFPLLALIKAGFHENPMILDICSIVETRALQDLKWRARVRLPTGVFLIGIADETGTLKEGEVFCQYQESDDTPPVIVESEVIVCRAPALHPGDVRRAFAVDNPYLRHLKNVLVFSVQGERDLPNMLGGGDLDGDAPQGFPSDELYGSSSATGPKGDSTAPQREFCSVMVTDDSQNDVLGQVDNCHLARSDWEDKGPFHPDCLELSEIHSTAVDFPKTGQAAILDPSMRPKLWPDFMDKDATKKTYESQKILGILFRIRDCVKKQETEACSRPESESKCTQEPLRDAYQMLVESTRSKALNVIERANLKISTTRLTPIQVIARHCYALTYEREYVMEWEEALKKGGDEEDGELLRPRPMISFAWTFWQELIQIAALPEL
ncbi:hypothetical protein TREMEDRAFT_74213 [Tremella mesenterica DSM 1558]|uniref:uncharacterized protein n=1 Tax=Tremella mesenterica (strain ATCC 24925 / CBS 8224 / DSM 1558 / NBRC 9311 / NRRL Y-6157 / RJB 2259-6 / UBC 559-6) TaxID=578456 RepID=UPI0003F48FE6|nr:uncharacterized protein TREMEDRAFT_74213 [Tremella mesenterica DSM 1558]EIW68226.1 hypothetical protein TREMEDRAFT_74213 [Tremella mesenterica DSM 1558]